MDILLPEYKKMLLLLVKYEVEFMLIGVYAVIFHGYERLTTDMDIFLNPENKNRDKLIGALKEFGNFITIYPRSTDTDYFKWNSP